MYDIDKLPQFIDIGFTGEHKFRDIQIDMSAWLEDMPNGVPSIVYIRPGETQNDAYIPTTTFSNNILTWQFTQTDVGGIEGNGVMQVWLEETENTTLVKRGKSTVVTVRVNGAITDPGDTDPPARTMLLNLEAEAETLAAGSSATAEWEHEGYYGDYKLKLGIPKGDKGDKGDQGDPAPEELITPAVDAYLAENFSNPSNPPLDRSLASSSSAAPADMVGSLKSAFNEFESNISKSVKSKNIYNEASAISGYYIDNTTGEVQTGGSYSYFDYMDCSEYSTLILSRSIDTLAGINIRYAFYDANKNYLSGGTGGGLTVTYDSDVLRYYATIATNGAKYIRLSYNTNEVLTNRRMCLGGSLIYVPYVSNLIPKRTDDNDHIVSSVLKNKQATATAASMGANDSLSVFANNVSTANEITFYAKITSFNRIDIGHVNASDKGIRLAIGNSKITYFVNGNNNGQVDHGLTIKDYIYVRIAVNNSNNDYKITIITNGGKYERTDNYWSGWYGSPVVTVGSSTSLTECKLVYNIDTLNSNYWIFGDSYLGKGNVRWPYYMFADGIKNVLLNAWPGASAQDIYPAFSNLIQKGNPQYALWFLGMNNADTTDLNVYWQINTENFIINCIANGIEPVLATIPNTPTQNNTKKNAYVKKCGLRYVDFASAVGASSANSSWYDGMLDSDEVHPTAYGAQALYLRLIADFPELLNMKELPA